jgi:hypothetical protein
MLELYATKNGKREFVWDTSRRPSRRLLANVMSKRSLAAKQYAAVLPAVSPSCCATLRKAGHGDAIATRLGAAVQLGAHLRGALRPWRRRASSRARSMPRIGAISSCRSLKPGLSKSIKDRDEARSAMCWIFTQMGERRTRDFVDLVTEFHVYMSICKPGEPRPTPEDIKKAFAGLPNEE